MSKVARVITLFGAFMLYASSSMAADFYMVGGKCKMTVGYLSDAKASEQLKTGIFPNMLWNVHDRK